MYRNNITPEEMEQHELIQGTVVHTLRRSLVSQLQSGPLVDAILEQLPTELSSSCRDEHVYEDGSIVSYRSGDFYDEHHDSYTYGEPLREKQRAYTVLLYILSPPGPPWNGGTEFTKLTHHNQQPLVVKPQAGDVLVWPNFDRQGLPYMDSSHRALPVESNHGRRVEKVVINMWFQGIDNALQ
jgi:Rps23 Pro-64 3,4-dihydroxylase Tpa1-like proline 4-hydroxylase